ncbi:MAG: hypothetical protein ACFB4I_09820 [Cyanophyceae cyanobacterium]
MPFRCWPDKSTADAKERNQGQLLPLSLFPLPFPQCPSPKNLIDRRHWYRLERALFVSACFYTLGVVGWLASQGAVESPVAPARRSYSPTLIRAIEPASPESLRPAPPNAKIATPKRAYLPVAPVKPLPKLALPPRLEPLLESSAAAPPPQSAPETAQGQTPSAEATPPTLMAAIQSLPELEEAISVPHEHRLIGILELGDRSVALVNFGSVTQQIAVGETVGSSGWTLTTVTQRSAEIRRQNEKRLVYVGQSF